jgi:uncharacterized protein
MEEAPRTPDSSHAAPALGGDRIGLLDTLRGFALLGILPMNMPLFAFYSFAFFTPSIAGGFEGVNFLAWLFGHVFFEFKMMTIFSALFGAGIVVFTTRAVHKTGRCAGLYYRRLAWLLVFGLIHAYLIWEGDILVAYAVCGAIAFLFRKAGVKALLVLGLALLLVAPAINVLMGSLFGMMRDAAAAVDAGTAAAWQEDWAEGWRETEKSYVPTDDLLEAERRAFEGGYLALWLHRAQHAAMFQFLMLPLWGVWRVTGTMLLGMAALKSGVFTGSRSDGFYLRMLAVGYLAGIPLVGFGAVMMVRSGFDIVAWYSVSSHFNYFGSLLVASGHVALVALAVRAGVWRRLTARLATVGQMAFTNYIAQSVICALLFYGYGFGLWNEVSRAGLWGIVALIWTAQLLWSPWWLARFRFGPLEWLWRSLTYWKAQPMRRAIPGGRTAL